MNKSKSRAFPKGAYEPTDCEATALEAVAEKARVRPPPPLLKMDFDEATRTNSVSFLHEDQTTAQVLGMTHLQWKHGGRSSEAVDMALAGDTTALPQ